jgi:hypothetical protein
VDSRNAADVTDREAASHWVARPEPYLSSRNRSTGEKAMRSILALSLLVTLSASANAATVHHAHHRHATFHTNQGLILSDPASGFAYAPSRPPIQYQPAPYYNDQPSVYDNRYPNWGG